MAERHYRHKEISTIYYTVSVGKNVKKLNFLFKTSDELGY